jgi:hypothetical protein
MTMAEIGIASSIIGCVDFGAQLSLALFEFAARIQAAPAEIRRLAQDITVFCSVLRLIDSVFGHPRDTQFSNEATSVILDITRRCYGCLNEIQKTLELVQPESPQPKTPKGDRRDETWAIPPELKAKAWRPSGIGGVTAVFSPSVVEERTTFTQRIKWVFSRSRIALLRQNLESMTITLHLMLTTLQLSGSSEDKW